MARHLLLESQAAGPSSPQGPASSSSGFTGMLASVQRSTSTWGLVFLTHRLGHAAQLCLARNEGQLLHAAETSTQVSEQSPSASYPPQLRGPHVGVVRGLAKPDSPFKARPHCHI